MGAGCCHEKESAGPMHCEGARAKSMRCGKGIQAREIRPHERAPLTAHLDEDLPCDPGGRRLGRK